MRPPRRPFRVDYRAFLLSTAAFALIAPASAQTIVDPITITASPIVPGQTSDVLDQSFSAVTSMTAEQLQRQGGGALGTGGELGNLLFDKPGIVGSTYAPGASRPIIRGLDNFRVRIQENGTSSMDVSEIGEDHKVPVDVLTADRLEVVRGPATLRFGPQAIGGVVAVENSRIPMPGLPSGLSGRIGGALSSTDRGWEGSTALNAAGTGGAIHLDMFGRNAGDYRIPSGGVQPNSASRANGGSVGGSVFFDGGYFGLALINTQALYHIPGLESAPNNVRIDLEQTKLLGKGEYRPSSSVVDAIRVWFGGTDYRHDEKSFSEDDGLDVSRATFKNREQEGRAEVQFMPVATPVGVWTAAPGIQFNHQKIGTAGEAGGLLAPAETTAGAFYLFNELRVTETLKLQAAGRVDRASVDGTPALFPADLDGGSGPAVDFAAKRDFTARSASFGLLQALPYGLVAVGNAQYVERAPRAIELFAKGAHDASATFEIGNPDLKIEAARGVEIGLRRPVGQWRFEATAFYTSFRNYIFKQDTGLTCDDEFDSCGTGGGTELTQVLYSQRDATFKGVEIATQLDVAPLGGGTLGVDGQYDFVDARFSDGTNVPRIPPHRLGGGVYWTSAAWFARVGLLHAFAQNRVAPNETPTAGYDLLKAEISTTLKLPPGSGVTEARFGIVGTNLLDDEVRNHSSFRKDEVLLPGRSVRLFATASF